MAWTFGDSFDLYAAVGDPLLGYWDSGVSFWSLAVGRFANSKCMQIGSGNGSVLFKASNVNDAVHKFNVAFMQSASIGGTTIGMTIQLMDGANNQCCIGFRQDGAIVLYSGTPAGAALATYTGAYTVSGVWYSFELEVVVNNTTGSFTVRKNGNPANDFTLGSLNTRAGSANNYCNRVGVGMYTGGGVNAQFFDDFLWRSDASAVPWVGDIRCYVRMPSTISSAQFASAPNPTPITSAASTTGTDATATARYSPFTPTVTGTIGSILANLNTGFTGNCKMSIFADTTGAAPGSIGPAAVLGSATIVVNPVLGNNTFTFGTPVAVTKGTIYWFGVSHDVTATFNCPTASGTIGRLGSAVAYASFPSASPVTSSGQYPVTSTINITPTNNADFVSEAFYDGTTTYVYDGTVGDADFYNIAAIASTPASVIAVTTRGYLEKSDAGARSGAVQLKSGAATVQSPSTSLSTNWAWLWRTDTVDPNTSAAWTATAVNSVTIGPIVTA
jgi:hypothetical protein